MHRHGLRRAPYGEGGSLKYKRRLPHHYTTKEGRSKPPPPVRWVMMIFTVFAIGMAVLTIARGLHSPEDPADRLSRVWGEMKRREALFGTIREDHADGSESLSGPAASHAKQELTHDRPRSHDEDDYGEKVWAREHFDSSLVGDESKQGDQDGYGEQEHVVESSNDSEMMLAGEDDDLPVVDDDRRPGDRDEYAEQEHLVESRNTDDDDQLMMAGEEDDLPAVDDDRRPRDHHEHGEQEHREQLAPQGAEDGEKTREGAAGVPSDGSTARQQHALPLVPLAAQQSLHPSPQHELSDSLASLPLLWLQSDIGVTASSQGEVQQWSDLSGHQHHFVLPAKQLDAGAAALLRKEKQALFYGMPHLTKPIEYGPPTLQADTVVRSMVQFPCHMQSDGLRLPPEVTLFFVLRHGLALSEGVEDDAPGSSFFGTYPSGQFIMTGHGPDIKLTEEGPVAYLNAEGAVTAAEQGPLMQVAYRVGTAGVEVSQDSGPWQRRSTNRLAFSDAPVLLGGVSPGHCGWFGAIGEVLLFPAALGDEEAQQVMWHLSRRWQLPVKQDGVTVVAPQLVHQQPDLEQQQQQHDPLGVKLEKEKGTDEKKAAADEVPGDLVPPAPMPESAEQKLDGTVNPYEAVKPREGQVIITLSPAVLAEQKAQEGEA